MYLVDVSVLNCAFNSVCLYTQYTELNTNTGIETVAIEMLIMGKMDGWINGWMDG